MKVIKKFRGNKIILKNQFAEEMEVKRAEWQLEKERQDQEKMEHNTLVKKDRRRDEEE